MCTAITYKTHRHTYFGRNLDLEFSYNENIVITPRNFPLTFYEMPGFSSHYAIIGVAFVTPDHSGQDYPLYYDAINEHGLGIAGLNFVGNAKYFPSTAGKDNITPFEFIPWILAQCATVAEAKTLIARMNFLNKPFSAKLPLSELHWIISDRAASIVVESTADGIHFYDNPTGVLANNPTFPEHLLNLNNYLDLSASDPANNFPVPHHNYYSRGLGTRHLPGGLDSMSRFVRASFATTNAIDFAPLYVDAASKSHAATLETADAIPPLAGINQFFHLLHFCEQPRGCDVLSPATSGHTNAPRADSASPVSEITVYTSGYDLHNLTCYYTTYDNHQLSAVRLKNGDLDSTRLTCFPMQSPEQVNYQL